MEKLTSAPAMLADKYEANCGYFDRNNKSPLTFKIVEKSQNKMPNVN